MTKLTPFLAGRISEHVRRGGNVAGAARHFRVSWSTAKRALSFSVRGQRKPHRPAAALRARRAAVVKLAVATDSRGTAKWPRFASAPAMAAELNRRGFSVSPRTVQRDLRAAGFRSRVRRFVPTRNPDVWARRLSFCKRVARTNKCLEALIKKIVFSDEHGMSSNDTSNRLQWVRSTTDVLSRERLRLQNTLRVQVWAAIGLNYKSRLVFLKKPVRGPAAADDDDGRTAFRQTSATYVRKCLATAAVQLQGRVFMQDGASAHTALRTMAYLARKNIDVLAAWPSHSPDLNPIEELWAELNRQVANMHPATQAELETFTQRVWDSFSLEMINKFVRSFYKKVKRCIKRLGQC